MHAGKFKQKKIVLIFGSRKETGKREFLVMKSLSPFNAMKEIPQIFDLTN